MIQNVAENEIDNATPTSTPPTILTEEGEPSSTKPLPSRPVLDFDKDPIISEDDFQMALEITNFSVRNSTIITGKQLSIINPKAKKLPKGEKPEKEEKIPVPEAEDITMEYLMVQHVHVRKLLCQDDTTKITDMLRLKQYPTQTGGRLIAMKFVRGVEKNGLGKYSPKSDSFKRHCPDDEDCPEREAVRRKWQRLNFYQSISLRFDLFC